MHSKYQRFQETLLRDLRAIFRLLRVGLHVLWATVLVSVVFPALGQYQRDRLIQRWAKQLLDMLSIEWLAEGEAMEVGLCVANHISWLDIIVITASMPSTFLAKEEVRRWPLIGWISAQIGTCYVQRGSRMAAYRSADTMTSLLQTGRRVVVFPEGTSSDGRDVLPFHSALMQSAINARVPLQPMALCYACAGGFSDAAAYYGNTSLAQSLWRIARTPALQAHLLLLSPMDTQGHDRRALSTHARAHIRQTILETSGTV
ncbi:MAG: 1-acyl-sn-glycerol-3-phosphate acyltransferase [Rhodoferax sp.]|nr:1-acyl-sn-glycerol-3-phosphate acyltransferase [Rhodoferax sp.]